VTIRFSLSLFVFFAFFFVSSCEIFRDSCCFSSPFPGAMKETMRQTDRRDFLSGVSFSLLSLTVSQTALGATTVPGCWLDVCAPFIVEDPSRGVTSELILTSDNFTGVSGYEDSRNATEYEIYLYDSTGRAIGDGGIARRLSVPALRTTVIPVSQLLGRNEQKFWGGLKVRLRPVNGSHASDLFSSAFVRWWTKTSFDNVHANPDPRQWQNSNSYYYSMPYPSLDEYDCTVSLFNPYDSRCSGLLSIRSPRGKVVCESRFDLKPHSSLLFDLNSGSSISDPWAKAGSHKNSGSGLLSITNDEGTSKGFAYLMIRARENGRFSVEHPIHQGIVTPKSAPEPFDPEGKFKARNVLYTPLAFRSHRVGAITLESRFFFGSGLPVEDAQWFYPFAIDKEGEAIWSSDSPGSAKGLADGRVSRGVIRMGVGESCELDLAKTPINSGFSGGLGVAVAPDISHTLMKVELRIPEWGAHAFTHFRPGLRSARLYQKPPERGGLGSDYIIAGAKLRVVNGVVERDELLGVLNIDDQRLEARPTLELFTSAGLVGRYPLGAIPPFGACHFLLSEVTGGKVSYDQLTLRLVDQRAALLMSAVHLDYSRREIALDHGSDRFSTFLDFACT
jgi:hypothetical protein